MSAKFNIYQDQSKKFRFRLIATNGEIIAVGEAYESKAACLKGIKSIQKNAPGAAIIDLSAQDSASAKKPAKKAASKKAAAKKAAAKKPAAKKPAAKKPAAKKTEVKKPAVKKPAAKKPEVKIPEDRKPVEHIPVAVTTAEPAAEEAKL